MIPIRAAEGRCAVRLRAAGRRHRRLAAWMLTGVVLAAGCMPPPRQSTGLVLRIEPGLSIPPGLAHAAFQHGRQVRATNKYDPYCELETRALAGDSPEPVAPGRYPVTGVSRRLLLDPITRIPALLTGIDCSDPVYQESTWWLGGEGAGDLLYLRCLAPYFDCRIGPPLAPDQVQEVLGRRIAVEVLPSGS